MAGSCKVAALYQLAGVQKHARVTVSHWYLRCGRDNSRLMKARAFDQNVYPGGTRAAAVRYLSTFTCRGGTGQIYFAARFSS